MVLVNTYLLVNDVPSSCIGIMLKCHLEYLPPCFSVEELNIDPKASVRLVVNSMLPLISPLPSGSFHLLSRI